MNSADMPRTACGKGVSHVLPGGRGLSVQQHGGNCYRLSETLVTRTYSEELALSHSFNSTCHTLLLTLPLVSNEPPDIKFSFNLVICLLTK